MSEDLNIVRHDPFKNFDESLRESHLYPMTATGVEVMQINFGRLCNQACKHCHVEAGPTRTEMIDKGTLTKCLDILEYTNIPTVDITGGAPELNSNFRWFVGHVRDLGRNILIRCNLSIVLEPGHQDLPEFYRDHGVEIIASLPYYLQRNVDAQRGCGVFEKSIAALKQLNEIGYGCEDDLILNLVYNPGGAFLPPAQLSIEADFKRELGKRYGICFNNMFTITNMPLGRFLEFLERTGNLHSYMNRLISAYNPQAAAAVMCRYTLSIDWSGNLFDCDFNQMLQLHCNHGAPDHLDEFDFETLASRRIVTGLHCYGCTAGAGSSCGGALTE